MPTRVLEVGFKACVCAPVQSDAAKLIAFKDTFDAKSWSYRGLTGWSDPTESPCGESDGRGGWANGWDGIGCNADGEVTIM